MDAAPEAPPATLRELWDRPARDPGAPALLAEGCAPLSHGDLRRQIREVAAFLRVRGLGRKDRVAAALPSGPEAALAFLGVSAACAYAPLNPAYRERELDAFLADIAPQALLVQEGSGGAARAVAAARGIPVIELRPQGGAGAGRFGLAAQDSGGSDPADMNEGGPPGRFASSTSPLVLPHVVSGQSPATASDPAPPEPGDLALLLHTSGTTSGPKLVPLRQRQVLASMANVQRSLALGPADRCLSFMPVFHLTGLITAVLASLGAGGSAVCIPEFAKAGFFPWLEAFRPTWYTAVPAIHQAIVEQGQSLAAEGAPTSLRLVRSSAAPLPPAVLAALERLFSVPVIEAYGMTETHQIASNPLPPLPAKAGSVGRPAGPEVAVLADDGTRLPPGGAGEIVVRGANVFDGYEGGPEANAGVFREGWFRTGDLGRFDGDGYLFIHGRAKDLINRGGQKVSPHEVEAVLRAHPGVREAVAFPVPHGSLGEAVAAAIVPAPGPPPGEGALRRFLAERLAPFKVPLRVLTVSEIPKGATGKVQRHALAGALQAALAQAPADAAEPVAAEAAPDAWAEAAATEAVLRRHPAVLRCAVLPKTDTLGQGHLAAYLVLSRDTSHEDLMLFVMQEGPSCVVPSAYVDLDAMPWTPEGQVDHRRLAALPVSLLQARRPRETAELILARLWGEVLKSGPGALSDDFFQEGGDSLKAVELLMRIEGELGVAIPPEAFFQRPTLGSLVLALDREDGAAPASALLTVQAGSGARPFFFVHGDFNGGGFHCLRLARLLGPERPFHTFQPHGFPGQPPPTSLEAMAEHYLPLLRRAQSSGPYLLGGHCNGALVAFELARRLRAAGEAVDLLALVAPPPAKLFGTAASQAALIPAHVEIRKQATMVRRAILAELYTHAVLSYAPRPYPGKVRLLVTADDLGKGGPDLGWAPLAAELAVEEVPGDHHSVLTHHLEDLAERLRPLLEAAPPLSGGSAG